MSYIFFNINVSMVSNGRVIVNYEFEMLGK